ncbi:MAG: hypothetical protein ACYTF3_08735 [Planctomycetota bacterium]|jgi:hypothetical protein
MKKRMSERRREAVARSLLATAIGCGLAAVAATERTASGEVLAAWNFNGFNPQVDVTLNADHGSGVLDLTQVAAGAEAFTGTDVNAVGTDGPGFALSVVGQNYNGRSIEFAADTMGVERLTISFAARTTASGFVDSRLDAFVAGDWIEIGRFSGGSEWPLVRFEVDMPASVGVGGSAFRFVLDGATSSSGNIRIDNLRVESRVVPAPGALALLGGAGLVARRRRRR